MLLRLRERGRGGKGDEKREQGPSSGKASVFVPPGAGERNAEAYKTSVKVKTSAVAGAREDTVRRRPKREWRRRRE